MIQHAITFVTITTLHLAFATFTEDIYRTDAATWSQTQTTTDWQDQTSGTTYQQMAATEIPESVTIVANTFRSELNVSLENLVSAFNTPSYVGNCSDLQEQTDADEYHNISYDNEFPDGLVRTTREMYPEFKTLIKTALRFICTGNTTVGQGVVTVSRMYVHNFTEFMVRLNGSAATVGQVAVLDTVTDLYRTGVQHVESVIELVENLTEMIAEEDKVYALAENMSQRINAMNFFNAYSLFATTHEELKEVTSLIRRILERAGNMSEHKDGDPFINVITSGNISHFLKAQHWTEILEENLENLDHYKAGLLQVEYIEFMFYKVTPGIMAIVLVVGITGNGLLLAIFVRHKETRTLANSMLINLTVVDLVMLVVNGLLDYMSAITPWQFGLLACNLYIFVSYLLAAVSTYSVATISVQRFVAIKRLPSLAWCHQSQKIKYVLIATVWAIGCILSLPHALIADIKNESCTGFSLDNAVPLHTADLFTFCVVPLVITATFSVATACRIRRSVRIMPGEATGQEQFKHNRMVSSNVLFALTGLFVVSWTPYFFFDFLNFVVDITVTIWELVLANVIVYYLRFVTCCLNPIVLFVLSKRYRGYIRRYCGQREVQPASSRGRIIHTSL